MNMKRVIYVIVAAVLFSTNLLGQNVNGVYIGPGNSTPDQSAMLEIESGGKGLLIPRMSYTTMNDIYQPAEGLLVIVNEIDTGNGETEELKGLYIYTAGQVWKKLNDGNSYWEQVDPESIAYFSDNSENMNVGINTDNPGETLDVNGIIQVQGVLGDNVVENAVGNQQMEDPAKIRFNAFENCNIDTGDDWASFPTGLLEYKFWVAADPLTSHCVKPTPYFHFNRPVIMKSDWMMIDATTHDNAYDCASFSEYSSSIGPRLVFQYGDCTSGQLRKRGEISWIPMYCTGGPLYSCMASGGFYFDDVIFANGQFVSSDSTLKKNITPLGKSLNKVTSLNAVTYQWKNDSLDNGRVHMGLIAQDLEQLFPEAVVMTADSTLAVDYQSMIAPLIEAIKEQQETIETLERAVNDLNQRVKDLEGN